MWTGAIIFGAQRAISFCNPCREITPLLSYAGFAWRVFLREGSLVLGVSDYVATAFRNLGTCKRVDTAVDTRTPSICFAIHCFYMSLDTYLDRQASHRFHLDWPRIVKCHNAQMLTLTTALPVEISNAIGRFLLSTTTASLF